MFRLIYEKGRLSIVAFLRLDGSQLDGFPEELSGQEMRVANPNLRKHLLKAECVQNRN